MPFPRSWRRWGSLPRSTSTPKASQPGVPSHLEYVGPSRIHQTQRTSCLESPYLGWFRASGSNRREPAKWRAVGLTWCSNQKHHSYGATSFCSYPQTTHVLSLFCIRSPPGEYLLKDPDSITGIRRFPLQGSGVVHTGVLTRRPPEEGQGWSGDIWGKHIWTI